jgi:basic membrane protein A
MEVSIIMKKRIFAIVLVLAMVFSLAACGGKKETEAPSTEAPATEAPATEAPETDAPETDAPETDAPETQAPETQAPEGNADMKVAMITDYGDITDQSFNQTAYEASKAFCEAHGLQFTYYKPESDSDADRVAMIDKAVADGYNVVVLPGFAFANAIYETYSMYPDLKYVALDVSEGDLTAYGAREFTDNGNVFSAVYQEEIAGYFAGYAAVKLGYTKLGFLGGMAVPAVVRYGYGFVQGADAAAAELCIKVEMNYAYGNQFYGDGDITAAMDTWYSGGTEIVFACGGSIYTSACEAAAKVNGKVIGVDVDQAPIIDAQYGEGMTVTSAMKGLKATVDTLLTDIYEGNWDKWSGKIANLGLVSGDDPEQNYVQIPASTQWDANFSQDDYITLVNKIFNGEITVSNDTTAEQPTAENVTVNFQGNIK